MTMNPPLLRRAALQLGALILLSSCAGAIADPTAYFPGLSADEKLQYADWLVARGSSSYNRSAYMPRDDDDVDGGAAVFWNVDVDAGRIEFAVAVRAAGWVGLGISEAGGMIGSDVVLFAASDPSTVVDAHVVGDRSVPIADDCQDWTLVDAPATGEDGWMIVEASRSIDTGDAQDRSISEGDADLWMAPTRIIAAWGDDEVASYHGNKKVRGSVRIFANYESSEVTEARALLDALEGGSDGYFDVVNADYEIAANETTYHYLCKTFDELNLDSSVTMIGAVPILDEDTAKFVHHFTVYQAKDCALSIDSALYRTMLYGWAPGDEGLALPNDIGFPMFDNENNRAVSIQIHYHNPSLVSGMTDSSGMRFYYANDERTHKAGILEIGDPWVMLTDTKINDGLTQYSFTCPGDCSSTFIAQEGVTILSESLHMHKTGTRMTNEVIRGGEVFHKAVVDVYDFDQQGSFHTPQEFYQVLPGDSFRTTCYYKDGSKFGLGSEDEMCIAFIMYYPARDLFGMPWICPHGIPDYGSGCSTELDFGDLDSVDDLGRSFGVSSGECVATPTTNSSTSELTNSPTKPLTTSPTETPNASRTASPTTTPMDTFTATPTETPTATLVEPPSETLTATPTTTPMETPASTPTEHLTATPVESPSETPTATLMPTFPLDTDSPGESVTAGSPVSLGSEKNVTLQAPAADTVSAAGSESATAAPSGSPTKPNAVSAQSGAAGFSAPFVLKTVSLLTVAMFM